ncbi:uncharacterized protein LOC110987337 [Acanthaster planci]|uniref:Uncharacterized protein LOC110987337 n=1 Tax=Acanthaster planci TaxID=133434 RepID=A0A8B7ZJ77_ACAPL|nr:uncharacterized protein LOC110987337 [Acanthaster planci]
MKTFIVSVIVVSVLFTYGADGQCYNCTFINMGEMKEGEEGCGNPFDSWGIKTIPCAGPCKTIYLETEGNEDWKPGSATFRTCHNEVLEGVGCTDMTDFEVSGMTLSQTCCSGALCNDNEFGGGGESSTIEWSSNWVSEGPGDDQIGVMMSIQMKVKCQLAGYSDPLQCTFASD